jgi:soluble lytic murein transglycosylase-like protein
MRPLFAAAACLTLLAASPAFADVFYYKDAEGVIHFTNVPTPEARQFAPVEPLERRHIPDRPVRHHREDRSGSSRYDDIIREYSERYQVEFPLVKAIIRAESGFNRVAVSRKGARGLMQLMPATARMHGVRNWYDPADNIRGGVKHLRMLLDEHRGNLTRVIAAYNAGSGAVMKYRGIPPYAETRTYVSRVFQFRRHYQGEERARLLASR